MARAPQSRGAAAGSSDAAAAPFAVNSWRAAVEAAAASMVMVRRVLQAAAGDQEESESRMKQVRGLCPEKQRQLDVVAARRPVRPTRIDAFLHKADQLVIAIRAAAPTRRCRASLGGGGGGGGAWCLAELCEC